MATDTKILQLMLKKFPPSVIINEVAFSFSYDGVPFLLHDYTLYRTTNIAEIFPDKAKDAAHNFNISHIQQLNAGSWFIEVYTTVLSRVLVHQT